MAEAVFGLIGVIIGGFISSGATLLLERRRERMAARVGARLVREDLLRAALWIEDALGEDRWVHDPALRLEDDAWREQRSHLAAAMDYADYAAVITARQALHRANQWLDGRDGELELNESDRRSFEFWLADLRRGLEVLLRLAQ